MFMVGMVVEVVGLFMCEGLDEVFGFVICLKCEVIWCRWLMCVKFFWVWVCWVWWV